METSKGYDRRMKARESFFLSYCYGVGVDVGGGVDPLPRQGCTKVEVGFPEYDGVNLPFKNLDYVYSSHMLEHTTFPHLVLQSWMNAVRVGGHVVVIVPHKFLYERKRKKPSKWNAQHEWFYSPESLLALVEDNLPPNTYRVRHLADNDDGYDYELTPDQHPVGGYEIELVLQKIQKPKWEIQ